MDIQEITVLTDYFIICTGTSNRMLDALADAVSRTTRKEMRIKGQIEGEANGGWIVVDYGVIIVHLFSPDRRAFYQLEELWREGKILLHLQ